MVISGDLNGKSSGKVLQQQKLLPWYWKWLYLRKFTLFLFLAPSFIVRLWCPREKESRFYADCALYVHIIVNGSRCYAYNKNQQQYSYEQSFFVLHYYVANAFSRTMEYCWKFQFLSLILIIDSAYLSKRLWSTNTDSRFTKEVSC